MTALIQRHCLPPTLRRSAHHWPDRAPHWRWRLPAPAPLHQPRPHDPAPYLLPGWHRRGRRLRHWPRHWCPMCQQSGCRSPIRWRNLMHLRCGPCPCGLPSPSARRLHGPNPIHRRTRGHFPDQCCDPARHRPSHSMYRPAILRPRPACRQGPRPSRHRRPAAEHRREPC